MQGGLRGYGWIYTFQQIISVHHQNVCDDSSVICGVKRVHVEKQRNLIKIKPGSMREREKKEKELLRK